MSNHTTKHEMMQDAVKLRKALGRNMTVEQIMQEYGWSRSSYYRRLSLARELIEKEYSFERVNLLFLRYEARMRNLQRNAETIAAVVYKKGNARAAVSALRFSADCENRILDRAAEVGLIPRAPQKHEHTGEDGGPISITFADFMKASMNGDSDATNRFADRFSEIQN